MVLICNIDTNKTKMMLFLFASSFENATNFFTSTIVK